MPLFSDLVDEVLACVTLKDDYCLGFTEFFGYSGPVFVTCSIIDTPILPFVKHCKPSCLRHIWQIIFSTSLVPRGLVYLKTWLAHISTESKRDTVKPSTNFPWLTPFPQFSRILPGHFVNSLTFHRPSRNCDFSRFPGQWSLWLLLCHTAYQTSFIRLMSW